MNHTDPSRVPIPGKLIDKLRHAREMQSTWADVEKEARTEIEQIMGDAETATYRGQPVITWKPVKSNRFDQAAFKKEHPDLHALFTTTIESRPFRPL
jgi:predicted phage-related endonuclease